MRTQQRAQRVQQHVPAEVPVAVNVYANAHNVHDSGVQTSTKKNILYIVNYRTDVPDDPSLWKTINDAYSPGLFFGLLGSPGTILSTYAKNPYVMHGVTFQRLVDRVWLRIRDTADADTRAELTRRFREEVDEGKTHCTNGMMVRLVNVFIGFDPNIVVKLNANQVLGARIPATQARVRKEMNITEEITNGSSPESLAYWIKCYKETVKDLVELEVGIRESEEEEIVHTEDYEAWLSPLGEPVLDALFEAQGWNTCAKTDRPMTSLTEEQREANESSIASGGSAIHKTIRDFVVEAGLNGYAFETSFILKLWRH